MIPTERFEQVPIASQAELRDWLAANHKRDAGVWIVRYQKSVPAKHLGRLELLDELLCWGWVDGIARKLDAERTMQLVFPRKQQAWAQWYKDRAAKLEAEGRLQAPGLAAIARSKAAGLWDAYAQVDALTVPDDLARALAADGVAQAYFDQTPPSYRRNLLRWVAQSKRPDTRARRIEAIVAACAAETRIPQL